MISSLFYLLLFAERIAFKISISTYTWAEVSERRVWAKSIVIYWKPARLMLVLRPRRILHPSPGFELSICKNFIQFGPLDSKKQSNLSTL